MMRTPFVTYGDSNEISIRGLAILSVRYAVWDQSVFDSDLSQSPFVLFLSSYSQGLYAIHRSIIAT